MATDYENGPQRTAQTDANVHSRTQPGMSQHMPDVHAWANEQNKANQEALNKDAGAAKAFEPRETANQTPGHETAAPTRADLDPPTNAPDPVPGKSPARAALDAASSFGEAGKQVTGRDPEATRAALAESADPNGSAVKPEHRDANLEALRDMQNSIDARAAAEQAMER